jgi:hypothetical protein
MEIPIEFRYEEKEYLECLPFLGKKIKFLRNNKEFEGVCTGI